MFKFAVVDATEMQLLAPTVRASLSLFARPTHCTSYCAMQLESLAQVKLYMRLVALGTPLLAALFGVVSIFVDYLSRTLPSCPWWLLSSCPRLYV